MSGGDSRPYREPCNGEPLCGLGPIWQHGTNTAKHVPEFINTTTVTNWTGTGTIAPYERWTPDPGGAASCDTHFCVPDGAPCSEWPKPYPTNTFASSGSNIDFSLCHKRGFKNVQARRIWHGCFGWVSNQVNCNTNLCGDGTGYRAWQGNPPDQTKYLTATYDVHVRNHFDAGEDAGGYLNADKTGARSVDPNTGEITSSLITTETAAQNYGGTTGVQIYFYTNGGAGYHADSGTVTDTFSSGGGTILDAIDNDLHCVFPLARADAFTDLPGFISAWNSSSFAGGSEPGNPFVSTGLPVMTDPNSYSASSTGSLNGGTEVWTCSLSFSRTATTVSWHFTITQNNGIDEDNTWEYYGSITLSSENASSAVYSDIKNNLLSLWPLNDDQLYPWRTDIKVSVAPLVSRNELGSPVCAIGFNAYTVDDLTSPINDASGNTPFSPGWTPTYSQRAWFDPNIYQWQFPPGMDQTNSAATGLLKLFDGSILGAPMPAGYRDFFDFGFLDVRGCCYRPPDNPGFQTWSWYQVGWGQNVSTFNSNSGCNLPLNSTQWNNWFEAVNKPQGAWLFYADKADYYGLGCVSSDAHSGAGDAGYLVACKYAEILEMWNSQNFARPGGDDKFLIDENHVFCASGSGSTWALVDPVTGLAPPDGTDFSGYWGGAVVNGFCNVTSYSSGTLTLGSKVWNVPSNWASKSNHDEASCFGKLRFSSYPSLLGRVAVTPDGTNQNFTFATAQPNFGMNYSTHTESIDLYSATMNLLASGLSAIRVDDSHFFIPVPIPNVAWVTIHGAPAWYVNDTRPKGEYAYLQWVADFRSPGEWARLAGVVDCSGTVAVSRPDNIIYPNVDCIGSSGTVAAPGNGYSRFCQTQSCIDFGRCNPRVVCISPNESDTFPNGVTHPFPASFDLDEQYGSKWWGFVQSTMTDLYWQQPHRPCNIESCAKWMMDGGLCADDSPLDCPAFCCPGDDLYIPGESVPPTYYYGHAPQVEARLSVPNTYGMGQNESGPALPSGIQAGWLSPVDHAYGSGDVAFPPLPPGALQDNGEPAGASTAWDLHGYFCTYGPGCRFSGYIQPGCPPT